MAPIVAREEKPYSQWQMLKQQLSYIYILPICFRVKFYLLFFCPVLAGLCSFDKEDNEKDSCQNGDDCNCHHHDHDNPGFQIR